MRKLLIIFISLLLCVETVFPTVKHAETSSTRDTGTVSASETNDLLRELIAINTKTDELLKEVMANKIKYGGTNSTGYTGSVNNAETNNLLRELITINIRTESLLNNLAAGRTVHRGTNSAGILKKGMFMALPSVIICIAWNYFSNNYLCGVPSGT